MILNDVTTINKNGLAEIISEKRKITKTEALQMVNDVAEAVVEAIIKNNINQVRIGGLGSFKKVQIKERVVISPKDKKKIKIPGYNQVSFRAGKSLKDLVKNAKY